MIIMIITLIIMIMMIIIINNSKIVKVKIMLIITIVHIDNKLKVGNLPQSTIEIAERWIIFINQDNPRYQTQIYFQLDMYLSVRWRIGRGVGVGKKFTSRVRLLFDTQSYIYMCIKIIYDKN